MLSGRKKPYLVAHRGNRAKFPENTLAAFRQAFADGADIVETDLWVSADGEFVCIHDDTVERTTNGKGLVEGMTSVELKALSIRGGGMVPGDDKIPLLRELLGITPSNVALALELKSDAFLQPIVAGRLIEELKIFGGLVIIISLSLERLQSVKRLAPEIPIGLAGTTGLWPCDQVELLGPYWPFLLANPYYVWLAHLRDQFVCPLDTSPDPRLWFYCLLGCDAILSDDTGSTARRLERWRRLFTMLHGDR